MAALIIQEFDVIPVNFISDTDILHASSYHLIFRVLRKTDGIHRIDHLR